MQCTTYAQYKLFIDSLPIPFEGNIMSLKHSHRHQSLNKRVLIWPCEKNRGNVIWLGACQASREFFVHSGVTIIFRALGNQRPWMYYLACFIRPARCEGFWEVYSPKGSSVITSSYQMNWSGGLGPLSTSNYLHDNELARFKSQTIHASWDRSNSRGFQEQSNILLRFVVIFP